MEADFLMLEPTLSGIMHMLLVVQFHPKLLC
jgi:hypothetical protein